MSGSFRFELFGQPVGAIEVARIAETSRTRMTAILNRNTHDVSTDLLLRILARLGYRVTIKFFKAA